MNLNDIKLALMTQRSAIVFRDEPTLKEIDLLRSMLEGVCDKIILEKLDGHDS